MRSDFLSLAKVGEYVKDKAHVNSLDRRIHKQGAAHRENAQSKAEADSRTEWKHLQQVDVEG